MAQPPEDDKIIRLPSAERDTLPRSLDEASRRDQLRQEMIALLDDAQSEATEMPTVKPAEMHETPPLRTVPTVRGVEEPPPGHRNATICPQCDHRTWIATKECRHCGLDIVEYRRVEEEARSQRIQELIAITRIEERRKCMMWIFGLIIGGVILVGKSFPGKDLMSTTMLYAGWVAIVLALLLFFGRLPRI